VCNSNDGSWVFDHACPTRPDAGHDAALDAMDGSVATLRDVEVDVPGANGGPGCADLEPPDCPLALALACGSAGCCGCEELFVCKDGGWSSWGTCTGSGIIAPN
jgi:hypothetical protein